MHLVNESSSKRVVEEKQSQYLGQGRDLLCIAKHWALGSILKKRQLLYIVFQTKRKLKGHVIDDTTCHFHRLLTTIIPTSIKRGILGSKGFWDRVFFLSK